jgi:hypothetical protein
MRRFLISIFVALTVVIPPVLGQDTQDEEPKPQSTVTEPTPHLDSSPAPVGPERRAAPPANSYRPTQKRPPAAQYSPLAAAGGYGHPGVTPWQAIVNYFNPHHLNMGQLFAERKQAWLDNALYNQYFWYSFWATGLLILSWFAIAWIHSDRHRATWELAECASDALRYSEYCKREAKEAIRRHNDHIEKCNRIIEDNRSGLMTTPEMAQVEDLKRDIKRLVADNDTLTKHNERLLEEKEQEAAEFHALSQRVEEVAKHLQANNGASKNPNTALVERIARLEGENRRLQQQLTRKANTRTTLNGEPNSGE